MPIGMDADIDPGGTRAKQAQAKIPAITSGFGLGVVFSIVVRVGAVIVIVGNDESLC